VRHDIFRVLFDRERVMPRLYESKEFLVRVLFAKVHRERRSRKDRKRRTEAESNSAFEEAATAYPAVYVVAFPLQNRNFKAN
jgi:hypothetical protein